MSGNVIKILLIEDNPGDARLIQEMLAEADSTRFELECDDNLSSGIDRLAKGGIDVILLDLSLPDSQGLDTLRRVLTLPMELPIIVILTGTDNEALAVQALRAGAQDYLIKGQTDGNVLVRSMRYAMERHQVEVVLRSLALIDELTGLYNRRGFLSIGGQHLKLADRAKREMVLFFADFDHLKQINDTLGHTEGDQALIETASILSDTFRKSDLIARLGGDEFAVLAIEARKNNVESITTRLQKNLEAYNAGEDRSYKLSLSVGASFYDPNEPCSIGELLDRADRSMYERKWEKQMGSSTCGARLRKQ
jgi:two-component system cell cycle response regulator